MKREPSGSVVTSAGVGTITAGDSEIEINHTLGIDHGSLIKGNDIGNLWLYANTSVYHATNAPYAQMYVQNSKYPSIPSISAGNQAVVCGFDVGGWWGIDVLGGLSLPTTAIGHERNVWYDDNTDTVKVWTASGLKTLAYAV